MDINKHAILLNLFEILVDLLVNIIASMCFSQLSEELHTLGG